MKICITCKQSKPLSEYHKHCTNKDGHQAICKACTAIYHKYCRQDKKLKLSYNARYKQYALRHPERIKAKNAVTHAIRDHRLQSPNTLHCMDCFGQATEYHHPSYAPEHRLDVIPVCAECHRQIHTNLRLLASTCAGAVIWR